jgi:hypothetical protein
MEDWFDQWLELHLNHHLGHSIADRRNTKLSFTARSFRYALLSLTQGSRDFIQFGESSPSKQLKKRL